MNLRALVMAALVLVLSGCAAEPAWQPEPQRWGEFTVRIETRPAPVVAGMNEFLVIVDRKRKGFFNDLIVKVRTPASDWRQAIPDGALGVYRKALPVRDPARDRLFVRLIHGGSEGELVFPLAPGASADAAR